MADDTRQQSPTSSPSADPNQRPYQGKIYEALPSSSQQPTKPENANLLPGGTANTAGGHYNDITVLEAMKTITPQSFTTLHQKPCVRDSLIFGIATGSAAGGVTAIWGKPVPKAANWAVGTFCAMSFAAYQICLTRRQYEKEGMQRAVELMDEKKEEKRKKLEEMRRQRREAKEREDARLEEERRRAARSWWKFW